jgi:hypothetical protein
MYTNFNWFSEHGVAGSIPVKLTELLSLGKED